MSCNYIVRNKIGRFRPSPLLPRYRVRDLTHASDNRFDKPPECPRIHNVVLLQIFDHAAMLLPNCLQVRDQIFKILTGRQEEIILLDKLWWAWSILYVLRVFSLNQIKNQKSILAAIRNYLSRGVNSGSIIVLSLHQLSDVVAISTINWENVTACSTTYYLIIHC